MKLKQVNYYGLNHDKISAHFADNPQYINDFPLEDKNGTSYVGAVYYVAKPNRKLGHKNYLIILKQDGQMFVTGMTKREIRKFSTVDAILCKKCDTLLVSLSGHHFNQCECENAAFADGGRNYTRYGAMKLDDVRIVRYDLLLNKEVK